MNEFDNFLVRSSSHSFFPIIVLFKSEGKIREDRMQEGLEILFLF